VSVPRRTDPRKTVGVFVREGHPAYDDESMVAPFRAGANLLRSSNAITLIRRESAEQADKLEHLREQIGRECPVHGHIEDPIIGRLGDEVAFVCPECSAEPVRAAWAAEKVLEA
jgi:hypothetical protein